MKILHICSSVNGGAGLATVRLHLGLLNRGIESKILTLKADEYDIPDVYTVVRYTRPLYRKFFSRFGLFRNKYQKQTELIKNLDMDCECLSFPESLYDLAEHYLVKDSDLINLQWIGDFIDYPTFFMKVNRPIVWTLHDKNPLLGCCHYELDYENASCKFKNIDNRFKKRKKRYIDKHENLTIVAPSKELGMRAKACSTFSRRHVETIPNGIDTSIYTPKNKLDARRRLKLDPDGKVILFSAHNLNNKWKGFKVLVKSLQELKDRSYTCIALGNNNVNIKSGMPIKFLGYKNDENEVIEAYEAADVFVIPTFEDNLPNTVLESLSCGTPIIGSNVGGIPDMVREGITGMLFKAGDSKELTKRIEEFFALPKQKRAEISGNCRRIAVEEYDVSIQAKRYIELYERII